jgi:hypothetical protein
MAEHTLGASACAVAFVHALGEHMAHEIFVLRADGAGGERLWHGVIRESMILCGPGVRRRLAE